METQEDRTKDLGTFLTDVSLEGPQLDVEYEGDGQSTTLKTMIFAQGKRREELEGYVNKIQSASGTDGKPLVHFPGNFFQNVQNLVSKSITEKETFLKDLQKLSQQYKENEDPEKNESSEEDAKIASGLQKIKKLDEKLKELNSKLKMLSSGDSKENTPETRAKSAIDSQRKAFMKDRQLKRVLDADGLSDHMKRNATLGPTSRFYTLTAEEEKLVEDVMNRKDDDEEDPYESVVGEDMGGDSDKRLAEIDLKLSEYSEEILFPSTPRPMSSATYTTAGKSPESVKMKGSESVLREAREVKDLLRKERDIDAKLSKLKQSELVLLSSEAIDNMLSDYLDAKK